MRPCQFLGGIKPVLAGASLLLAWTVAAQIIAMPQVDNSPSRRGTAVNQVNVQELRNFPITGVLRLPPPSAAEVAVAKLTSQPNAVGFGRSPPDFNIFNAPSGAGVIRISVTSEGAKAIRIGLGFSDDAEYEVSAWAPTDESAVIADLHSEPTPSWAAVTSGDTQELLISRKGPPGDWGVSVVRISHFERDVLKGRVSDALKSYGDSAYCQVDVACVLDVLTEDQQAVALGGSRAAMLLFMTFASGETGSCTGTLLNTASYPAAIVLTANHCVAGDSGNDLLTGLTVVYFFSRASCGSSVLGPYVQVVTSGTRLWNSASLDGAVLRLNQPPPAAVSYAGWNASEQVDPRELAIVFHHPLGDVKKASIAEIAGSNATWVPIGPLTYAPGTFFVVDWDLGIVEPGSSGSGLFTENDSGTALQLRATLTGGAATCSATKSRTYYSKLSNMYPFIQKYLSQPIDPPPPPPPPPPTGGKVQVVEYYNASLNHYFITSNTVEIGLLGHAPFQAWQPTGLSFLAYAPGRAPVGTVGICRFFNDHFAGISTHFYAPHGLGCEATIAGFPDWTLEDAQLFYAALPNAAGNCSAGNVPVYRLYNNGMGGAPNHRFTISAAVRQQMLSAGYTPEGSGIGVGWCAPQ